MINLRFSIWVIAAVFGLAQMAMAAPDSTLKSKWNVCSITINSSDELNAFKTALPKNKFNFIELTPSNTSDTSKWFTNACSTGVQCDSLIISGHFGGSFFGSSGLHLGMDDLEQASCSNSCPGILSSPKEVFFFGCNTLSGKGTDTRSPEEYVDILVHDGIPRAVAVRVAAYRYSPLGASYGQRMQAIFHGVPSLNGFSSVAPLGKSIAPFIKQYLLGNDYSQFLSKLKNEKEKILSSSINTSSNQDVGHNPQLEKLLKWSSFTVTRGLPLGEKDPNHELLCKISTDGSERARGSPDTSLLVSARALEEALSANFEENVPLLEAFVKSWKVRDLLDDQCFDCTNADKEALSQIEANINYSSRMGQLINNLNAAPDFQLELLTLSRRLKWVTKENYLNSYEAGIEKIILNSTLANSLTDRLRSLRYEIQDSDFRDLFIDSDSIPERAYQNASTFEILGDFRVRGQRVQAEATNALYSENPGLREKAIRFFWSQRWINPPTKIFDILNNDPSEDVRIAALGYINFNAVTSEPGDVKIASQKMVFSAVENSSHVVQFFAVNDIPITNKKRDPGLYAQLQLTAERLLLRGQFDLVLRMLDRAYGEITSQIIINALVKAFLDPETDKDKRYNVENFLERVKPGSELVATMEVAAHSKYFLIRYGAESLLERWKNPLRTWD